MGSAGSAGAGVAGGGVGVSGGGGGRLEVGTRGIGGGTPPGAGLAGASGAWAPPGAAGVAGIPGLLSPGMKESCWGMRLRGM